MANLRFVYRKSALKLGTVAVRILLENASFRQTLKPVRTSKLTFPRVIWRHPAKHPLGFRVVLVTTTSIHLHILFRSNLTGNSSPAPFKPNYYNKNSAFRQPFFICPAPRRNAPCFSILHYNKTGVCRSDESGRRRFLFLKKNIIFRPARWPERLSGHGGGSQPRQRSHPHGLQKRPWRSPRRGGRAGSGAPCGRAWPLPAGCW